MTKKFWCVFRFTVHLQNANAKFHKVGYRDTIQVRRKAFTFLYDKFTKDNMYQILSQYILVFFSVPSVVKVL